MSASELLLIDLSSIAYPIYLTSASHADPNHASQEIVARIRTLALNHPSAAICCDSGKSFRADVAPSYKANRPEAEAPLHHQIGLAKEQLEADGFPIWAVRTFEADDLIAAATTRALATEDLSVLIVSADKDLLQLVGPRVRAMSVRDGAIVDEQGVFVKFGVRPDQMLDYLTLVGDNADNVKGAQGIGPKTAATLLAKYGTLATAYDELSSHPTNFKPALASSLKEFQPRLVTTRTLIQLRTDVDIPFHEIAKDRVPQEQEGGGFAEHDAEPPAEDDEPLPPVATFPTPVSAPSAAPSPSEPAAAVEPAGAMGLMRRESTDIAAPVEWALQPHTLRDARTLATDMYKSRMFAAYGSQEAVLSTIMVGRELGLPAMGSLRTIHNIEGKHSLSASVMAALVLKSRFATYFEPISFDEQQATYETHRRGARNPVRLTHTFEMALKAWPKTRKDWRDAFDASGWGRNPTDMLVARAQARLARMVYPDLLAGMYTPEEIEEIRQSQLVA